VFIAGCVSTIPKPEQEKSTGSIKEFPELNKTELYKRSLTWVARTYNSANDVIQLKDPDAGQIICRGMGKAAFDFGIQRHFSYTMIIDIKDGKIRTTFEHVQSEMVGEVAGPNMDLQWETVANYFKDLNENLFTAIDGAKQDKNW
jgi:hypothetical protein